MGPGLGVKEPENEKMDTVTLNIVASGSHWLIRGRRNTLTHGSMRRSFNKILPATFMMN